MLPYRIPEQSINIMIGKTDRAPVDLWTLGHAGVGGLLAKFNMKPAYALGFAILWEIIELPFTRETLPNIVIDAIATYAGYAIVRKGMLKWPQT